MDNQEEYLISYVNLKLNLFKFQKDFLSEEDLENYYKFKHYGIPLCLPRGIKYFDYSNAIFFKVNKKKFTKFIFATDKIDYIGVQKYFRYGNEFAYNATLKKKYINKFNYYSKHIKTLKSEIKKIKDSKKQVCSMQIRNVPHFGHEAIFKNLLHKFNVLILNPIFGIKKKGDFSDLFISRALKYMEKKYKNIHFLPIYSNFHYGGPREAIHHLIMRESLGFENFYVGRDHAGAENLYHRDQAVKLVSYHKSKFKINIISSKGGFYCRNCNDYLVKDSCLNSNRVDISGSDFRSSLLKKKVYSHADPILQKKLFNYL